MGYSKQIVGVERRCSECRKLFRSTTLLAITCGITCRQRRSRRLRNLYQVRVTPAMDGVTPATKSSFKPVTPTLASISGVTPTSAPPPLRCPSPPKRKNKRPAELGTSTPSSDKTTPASTPEIPKFSPARGRQVPPASISPPRCKQKHVSESKAASDTKKPIRKLIRSKLDQAGHSPETSGTAVKAKRKASK